MGTSRDFRGQSGLADARLAEEPKAVRLLRRRRNLCRVLQLLVAPDERIRRARRQLQRYRKQYGDGGGLPRHAARGDGFGQSLQLQQTDELEVESAATTPEHANQLGTQNLVGRRARLEANGFDHCSPEDVGVAAHDIAGRHADAHVYPFVGCSAARGIEPLLNRDRGLERVRGRPEGCEHAIARVLDDVATVELNGFTQQHVVLLLQTIGTVLAQTRSGCRRVDPVGAENGDEVSGGHVDAPLAHPRGYKPRRVVTK